MQLALLALTGMTIAEINVAKERDVCHGQAPYIIVARSHYLAARLYLKQGSRHAPETYKDKISNSDAGIIHTWSLVIDWKGTKDVFRSKVMPPLVSPSIPVK